MKLQYPMSLVHRHVDTVKCCQSVFLMTSCSHKRLSGMTYASIACLAKLFPEEILEVGERDVVPLVDWLKKQPPQQQASTITSKQQAESSQFAEALRVCLAVAGVCVG